jgi:predicted RecB family nuclease
MHVTDGKLYFSPSDLAEFMACEHAISLHLKNLDSELKKAVPDETLKILQDHGDLHEKSYLGRLKAAGRQVVEIPGKLSQPERYQRTLQAMKEGAEIIFQAALEEGSFRGYADFLLRRPMPSLLGSHSYEVADTKLASTGKARHLVQIALYSDMVTAVQGVPPAEASLELGSGESKTYRLDNYRHYVNRLKARFLKFVEERPTTEAKKCDHCGFCVWKDLCADDWTQADHLNQVARISSPQIKRLKAAGVMTLAALAEANVLVPGMASLDTLRRQAQLQLHKRTTGEDKVDIKSLDSQATTGFYRLPAPDQGDMYFDMEGYPYVKDGLEYLFGVSYLDGGELRFKPFWGHDRHGERQAFEQFIDFVMARISLYPNLHIYHYADYERRALRSLMSLHGTREKEVDQLLREQRLIDLYAVVRESIMTSEPRYSIKNLETFYMKGERESDVKTAGASIVFYEKWRHDKNQQWLDDIERYNKEDCISTKKLHDWLCTLKTQAERDYQQVIPWYVPKVSDETEPAAGSSRSEAALAAQARKENARARLEQYLQPYITQDKRPGQDETSSSTDSQLSGHPAAVQNLLYLLDFYWREAKPGFWKMFDQQKRSFDELIDDMDVLSGLIRDPKAAPVVDKQSLIYTYRIPAQDHRLKLGDSLRETSTLHPLGTLHALDADSGKVEIRIGKRTVNGVWAGDMPLVCAVAASNVVSTGTLEAAILRFAEDNFERPSESNYQALWQALNRQLPRISGFEQGAPILPPASTKEQLIDVVTNLDHSYLIIQGPPGTGKTYTGARVVLALLAKGKRVGISALSHQAIANFLDAITKAAIELNQPFVGSRKSDGAAALSVARFVEDTEDPETALDRQNQLVAGTAWLFARESADQAFDYLFIDEAGQTSLANLVAMGTAAKNLVLLGDQMQLGQPLQGKHPGGVGKSALEYLLGDAATVPPEQGVLLDITWRMHPVVCQFISNALYDGRLKNHASTQKQSLELSAGHDKALKRFGITFETITHEGCAQTSDEEARRIDEIINSLLRQSYIDADGVTKPISEKNILVVAPYNAQVRLLKQKLPPEIKIGTVDKFQGMEAEVVIVSMTTSSEEEMPRDMAFLFDRRRLNVAISRAKTLAIIVCSDKLLDVHCKTPEQMALVDTLCWANEIGM